MAILSAALIKQWQYTCMTQVITIDSEVIPTSSNIMNTQYIGWNSLQLCTGNYWKNVETCGT